MARTPRRSTYALYRYMTVETFVEHMGQYAGEALEEGLFGWHVSDCVVTITDCGNRPPGTCIVSMPLIANPIEGDRGSSHLTRPLQRFAWAGPSVEV